MSTTTICVTNFLSWLYVLEVIPGLVSHGLHCVAVVYPDTCQHNSKCYNHPYACEYFHYSPAPCLNPTMTAISIHNAKTMIGLNNHNHQ